MANQQDIFFMEKALELARKAQSWTDSNPMVGAVIVKNGEIIGSGFHTKYGAPHAEVEALNSVRNSAKDSQMAEAALAGSTIYVTLEPCSHFGKTPPCVDALIVAKVARVVCAHSDPNPVAGGKSFVKLHENGIEVELGVLQKEALILNESFVNFHTQGRPFVAAKFAASLDGKIASFSGESKWITNEKSRAYARELRSQYQSILVGKNTVLKDDPNLGCRDPNFKDPLRIILDSTLSAPLTAQVFRDENVIVATTEQAPKSAVEEFEKKGIRVLIFPGKKVPILPLLEKLKELKIISVFVEGGAQVLGSFFDAGVVDKVYAFHAPIIIGGAISPSAVAGQGFSDMQKALRLHDVQRVFFDEDFLTMGYTRPVEEWLK